MKNVLLIALLLLTVSCKQELCDCYHGYVYDFDKTPLNKVKIYYKDSTDFVLSNKEGYFEVKKSATIKYLLFEKENYRRFSLSTFDRQNEFIKEQPFGDTIYLISKNSKHRRPQIALPIKK